MPDFAFRPVIHSDRLRQAYLDSKQIHQQAHKVVTVNRKNETTETKSQSQQQDAPVKHPSPRP